VIYQQNKIKIVLDNIILNGINGYGKIKIFYYICLVMQVLYKKKKFLNILGQKIIYVIQSIKLKYLFLRYVIIFLKMYVSCVLSLLMLFQCPKLNIMLSLS
jgi:hypothetical protein